MKKAIILSILALGFTFTFTSCKKKKGCMDLSSITYDSSAEKDDGSCQYAGTGGSTTLVAYPKHHGKDTRPYNVYVKFNTQDFPGSSPSSYDLNIVADTTENHIEIDNLKPGKYYIYMTAYDTSISGPVIGGIPYILTQASGEIELNVPVTE